MEQSKAEMGLCSKQGTKLEVNLERIGNTSFPSVWKILLEFFLERRKKKETEGSLGRRSSE